MEGQYSVALSVPPEIFLEIIAYYHNTRLPYERHPKASSEKILFGRFEVLRALSRTCQYFRRIFFSLVWEHLELLDTRTSDRRDPYPDVLARRMTGILKTPSVPRCIRTTVVDLKSSSQHNWNLSTVFVRLLTAARHLTSLHIIDISGAHVGLLSELLETRSFPSIRTLAIPCSLSRCLSAFPNIHSLVCADTSASDYYSIALLKASNKHCPLLDDLVNFTTSIAVIKCLLQLYPFIKTLRFRHVLSSTTLELLCDLQHLHSIRFPYRYQHRGETLETISAAAKAIFCSSQEQKPIQVQYSTPEADIGDVVVTVGISTI
ncbi:hypothetical protein MVEN_01820600 [Mycena venus]|uniref:F-box domain-containing protein n=1 Tax=Mycena venus TaxID=2733690 RepID=A0A8H6XKV6_9AGAR|nr:hypothetical protein MVEN_01820600 [Mycena venus]